MQKIDYTVITTYIVPSKNAKIGQKWGFSCFWRWRTTRKNLQKIMELFFDMRNWNLSKLDLQLFFIHKKKIFEVRIIFFGPIERPKKSEKIHGYWGLLKECVWIFSEFLVDSRLGGKKKSKKPQFPRTRPPTPPPPPPPPRPLTNRPCIPSFCSPRNRKNMEKLSFEIKGILPILTRGTL